MEVRRLSGAVDTLPVIAEEEVLGRTDPFGGEMLTVTGQIRSHNLRDEGQRHLLIFVLLLLLFQIFLYLLMKILKFLLISKV